MTFHLRIAIKGLGDHWTALTNMGFYLTPDPRLRKRYNYSTNAVMDGQKWEATLAALGLEATAVVEPSSTEGKGRTDG